MSLGEGEDEEKSSGMELTSLDKQDKPTEKTRPSQPVNSNKAGIKQQLVVLQKQKLPISTIQNFVVKRDNIWVLSIFLIGEQKNSILTASPQLKWCFFLIYSPAG